MFWYFHNLRADIVHQLMCMHIIHIAFPLVGTLLVSVTCLYKCHLIMSEYVMCVACTFGDNTVIDTSCCIELCIIYFVIDNKISVMKHVARASPLF